MRVGRAIRIGLLSLGVIVVIGAAVVAAFVWRINPNAYKPRIEAAASEALGRPVALNGPIGLAWSLRPTIAVQDVTLANPAGFSTPVMARVKEIDLRLDLPALLGRRLVVQQLALESPQITLERNTSGQGNWAFTQPRKPAAAPSSAPPSQTPASHAPSLPFVIEKMHVAHAEITYRDDRTAMARTIEIPAIDLAAASPTTPVHLTATAAAGSDHFDLSAETGPLDRLLAGAGPWPFSGKLHATGALYDATLELSAPNNTQPAHAVLAGLLRGKPFSVKAQIGGSGAPLGAQSPLPISIQAEAAQSALTAQGIIADPSALTGAKVALSAQAPDLAALGAFAGTPLPPLRKVTFSGDVSDVGGLAHGVAIRGLHLAAEQGDLSGELQAIYAGRPSIRADLTGNRLDLSGLRSSPPTNGPAPAPGRQAPAPGSAASGHLISDMPLPFAELKQADADISLKVAALQSGKLSLQNVAATAHLADGALAAKGQASLDRGPVNLIATADARPNPPVVGIAFSAPSLPVSIVLAALHSPDYASGNLAVLADIRGAGISPHAIAAGLNGRIVLTMRGGRIDTRLLERSLGPAIAQANPVALLSHGEVSDIRCLAIKGSIANGQVTLAPLLLSSGLITVSGSGVANLASETLNLRLRPEGRVGGVAFSVPATVTGSFRSPRVEVARGSAGNAGAAAVLGLLSGKNVGNALGSALGDSGPSCPAALAEATGGTVPRPAARSPAAAPTTKVPDAGALLRRFLQ